MAKKRKTKAATKKTAKKTKARRKKKIVDVAIGLRHYIRSKIASHGPADVEGASMIARDAPAQVRQQRASARRRLRLHHRSR